MRTDPHQQLRAPARRAAFTLTEVLVVAAIIALLVAILVPASARARAQGRSTHCLSNLHSLQTASQMYTSQHRGYLPPPATGRQPAWGTLYARQMGVRSINGVTPVDKIGAFHCAEREMDQATPFLDYVANSMDSAGPDSYGNWTRASAMRVDRVRRPARTIYLADAERERLTVHIAGHPGGATVADARMAWLADKTSQAALDTMTVWTGSHLPEGKDCVNDLDIPGVRRVGRKLHLGRFTNSGFMDGHAASFPPANWPNAADNYGVWLSAFGVRDAAVAKLLPIQ